MNVGCFLKPIILVSESRTVSVQEAILTSSVGSSGLALTDVALMVAVPCFFAVTKPVEETVATPSTLSPMTSHVTVVSSTGLSSTPMTVASNLNVSLTSNVKAVSFNETLSTGTFLTVNSNSAAGTLGS